MPKVKQILKDSSVETAQRRRKCHRNANHSIEMGELCLVVRDPATGSKRNYCADCAEPIIEKAREDLHELESMLVSNP